MQPLPEFSRVPLAQRVQNWSADELGRWARQMAVACAEAGEPLLDDAFGILPSGASTEEAYLRSADPSFWRRKGARCLRIAQEAVELKAGEIGKAGVHQYAGKASGEWAEHKRKATAAFLKHSVVFDHATGSAIQLGQLVKTQEAKAARYYAFLKGIQALADGLRWAMLTITLPPEFHANPGTSKAVHAWNGETADQSHRVIAEGWKRIRAALRKHGILLSGVRTEEPMADCTPHWHCAFFFRDDEDLREICRAVLRQFPAGLRIRKAIPTRKGKLRFSAKQFRTLADLEAGKHHFNTKEGAQCQLDIGTLKSKKGGQDGIRSFASYILKYVAKTVGVDYEGGADQTDSLIEAGPAEKVRQHRETYGIRAIEFYGIPKGAATCWDLLRQVKLEPAGPEDKHFVAPPPAIAELAAICQREQGEGMTEYLRRLGGLAIAPLPVQCTVKPLKTDTTTRYHGKGVRLVGVQLTTASGTVETHVIKTGDKEILRGDAAEAIKQSAEKGELGSVGQFGDAATAEGRGLVQIGTVVTASTTQREAVKADPAKSHTVIAAAGSGKTTVLVDRAAYLAKQGIRPQDIAITTFTREAADNIRARLAGKGLDAVQVGTMHSLSGYWLHSAGVQASGFDDAIVQATAIGKRDKHILLDEAQDLSPDQWAWAKANAKTLYSVGDFRQAIYGWRSAKRGALLDQALETGRQPDMFSEGGEIDLPYNLRSASAIVALGNAVAAGSRAAASVTSGGEVHRVKVRTEREEVMELICWAEATPGRKAVLARTNSEVAYIKAEMTLAGFGRIPVLTVHASKGQEFDHVALACGRRKPSETNDEARETMYVAVTRAKSTLFITSIGQLPSILQKALEETTGRVP